MPETAARVDGRDDVDPLETREWVEALEAVLEREGPERATHLIDALIDKARRSGAYLPYRANTAYTNTIPVHAEVPIPGDRNIERRIKNMVRWNAMAMVVRANRANSGLGGHIASYASSATLYEVGFNHFFRAQGPNGGGDLLYVQGHSSPGIYARAFLEGRLSEGDLTRFRREARGNGLSSYPHPWLMRNFWQFPTVSMGLGPLTAIYQARFMEYLRDRELLDTSGRKVWCFCGDGEMDEPESSGAISLAARERLDNLVFVINCNLQRLDGPVRGNSSIIQELEALFRGAGWNVIKLIWGGYWDSLFQLDTSGMLVRRMEEVVDGEYQGYTASGDGAHVREHFFGKYPKLKAMVAKMTDEDIWRLNRGGHDPHKVYNAFKWAAEHKGQPTVILAKTVKGYGMGEAGEGQNITHQQKKLGEEALRHYRDRFKIPVSDADLHEGIPFYRPPDDSPEIMYMKERRAALGGSMPARRVIVGPLKVPELDAFKGALDGSGERELSTTMTFVRLLAALCRDKAIKERIVPIVADESRTFGMEGMFRQLGIYSHVGQLYTPMDADQLAYYREDRKGQILQEGINEAGAMGSWIAAGASYANHDLQMIPFFIFYSMFGFQRVGDLIWAGADSQARGFLIGGTSGRTTLSGEGLQHQDGHSHLAASTIPNCVAYDPTYAFELAVIIQEGLRRMYAELENVFYYVTVVNENYPHPKMPEGAREGILRGMYKLWVAPAEKKSHRVQLMGSGAILREVENAGCLLWEDWDVASDVWSVTSFNELRRDGMSAERHNRLHPMDPPRVPWVAAQLDGQEGPIVAATDYVQLFADQIRPFVGRRRFVTLGTDGFGRSDTRPDLRSFFEVDRYHIIVAALKALADDGAIELSVVQQAIDKYGIDPARADPTTV